MHIDTVGTHVFGGEVDPTRYLGSKLPTPYLDPWSGFKHKVGIQKRKVLSTICR